MPSLRTALALTLTAAASVVAPAAVAAAATPVPLADALPADSVADALPTQYVLGALGSATAGGVGPVKHLTLDPLSGTGTDPLDNAVGTQVADFRPVSTAGVTAPLTGGGSLSTLPVAGPLTALLPG
ncbi:hypothetical protein [Actinacidiphila acididurans]|uniref:Secreted protein n=1 Tax=Actinacidiphila acididurans TaxID=2784346 RepID=A0ABS2TQS4_9ACTN|nr:hypothetical protein [Actinacidiphila acididurans]MBM9504620.1 hypothetical protein [Actinacidiphila acididurans]